MLHFAYGSNMHRAIMRRHAPNAQPVGIGKLAHYRFVITADGYASIEPARAQAVYGLLWRLTPRDRATLDAWENIAGGLYRAETMPVAAEGRRRPALVYLARPRRTGAAKAGYMEIVVAAARQAGLPADYIESLKAWLPRRRAGAWHRKLGDLAWS